MKIQLPKSSYSLILYLILIFLIIIFGIMPQISNLNSDQSNLSENNRKIAEAETKISDLSKYEKDKTEIGIVEKTVNNLLPATKDSSGFVVQIEALGNELSIVIPTLTITESAKTATPVVSDEETTGNKTATTATPATTNSNSKSAGTAFNLSFRSSYPLFKTFLEKIESFPRFTTLNSVSVSGYNLETDSLQYDLKGNIYNGQ